MQIRLDATLQLAGAVEDSRSPTWSRDGSGWMVRRFRTIAGLTQEQLAARLSCSRTRVTWIESARQAVTLEQLEEIATACGLELTLFVRRVS